MWRRPTQHSGEPRDTNPHPPRRPQPSIAGHTLFALDDGAKDSNLGRHPPTDFAQLDYLETEHLLIEPARMLHVDRAQGGNVRRSGSVIVAVMGLGCVRRVDRERLHCLVAARAACSDAGSAVVVEVAHPEIGHLEGGLLAEELAAVASDFAQPGASATMHNVIPESVRIIPSRPIMGVSKGSTAADAWPEATPLGTSDQYRARVRAERPAAATTNSTETSTDVSGLRQSLQNSPAPSDRGSSEDLVCFPSTQQNPG